MFVGFLNSHFIQASADAEQEQHSQHAAGCHMGRLQHCLQNNTITCRLMLKATNEDITYF